MPKVTQQRPSLLSALQKPRATLPADSCSGCSEQAVLPWKLSRASWEDKDPLCSAQPRSVTEDPLLGPHAFLPGGLDAWVPNSTQSRLGVSCAPLVSRTCPELGAVTPGTKSGIRAWVAWWALARVVTCRAPGLLGALPYKSAARGAVCRQTGSAVACWGLWQMRLGATRLYRAVACLPHRLSHSLST